MEAANVQEAMIALQEQSLSIDVILCDLAALGTQAGFTLANWVRTNRPEFEVRLAGGLKRLQRKRPIFATRDHDLKGHTILKALLITSSGSERAGWPDRHSRGN